MSKQEYTIGHCMTLLPDVQTGSVDMIVTDLPYEQTHNAWDASIPLPGLWQEYNRITKENAAIILFGQGSFTAELMRSNQPMWRYNLVWEKDRPTGFLNAAHMPLRSHEDICVFYAKLPTYNPQFWEGKPLHGMGQKFKAGGSQTGNYGKYCIPKNPSAARAGDRKKYPRSVLHFRKPHPAVHSTQKPVELIEYLIRTYSNPGDLIHDSCLGSGTTLLACKNTERDCIGFELFPSWVSRYEAMLNTAQKELSDFGDAP